jgi:hypothetical protein
MGPSLALLLGNHSYSAAFSKSPRYRGVNPPNVSAGSDNTRKKLDPTTVVVEGRKAWSVALNAGGQAFFYATADGPFPSQVLTDRGLTQLLLGVAPTLSGPRSDIRAFSPIISADHY